jgi:hypothetical protein
MIEPDHAAVLRDALASGRSVVVRAAVQLKGTIVGITPEYVEVRAQGGNIFSVELDSVLDADLLGHSPRSEQARL